MNVLYIRDLNRIIINTKIVNVRNPVFSMLLVERSLETFPRNRLFGLIIKSFAVNL